MRICVVGHSMAHIRQQTFFRGMSALANGESHDVLILGPQQWGNLKMVDGSQGIYSQKGLLALNAPSMYTYDLVGLEDEIKAFGPDILYIQNEVSCYVTYRCLEIAKKLRCKSVVFVWENNKNLTPEEESILRGFDLCICGNGDAMNIHKGARRRAILPQVGVDTDHFQARPDIEREIDVAYVGRPVPEKGIHYLEQAWPQAKFTPWTDWIKMPWLLSKVKVVAAYSLDTQAWREQAMPYSAAEALSMECAAVVSDGGAIPFWLGGGFADHCPGVRIVPQHRPELLRNAIEDVLQHWEDMGKKGRVWVSENISGHVVSDKLIVAFKKILEEP